LNEWFKSEYEREISDFALQQSIVDFADEIREATTLVAFDFTLSVIRRSEKLKTPFKK